MRGERLLPALAWLRGYGREEALSDTIAASIVTVMLIPQSLAYAMLAGLPPEVGLYASIAPLIAYAAFGSSRTLSVGPVAVISLMTATATAEASARTGADPVGVALALAFLSGLFLVGMGLLRLGFLANLLSHPVISGFITASAILITVSQLPALLGLSVSGHGFPELVVAISASLPALHLQTLALGLAALVLLLLARQYLRGTLRRLRLSATLADGLARAAPMAVVILSILAVQGLDLEAAGVRTVGTIPPGLPPLTLTLPSSALLLELLPAAVLISVVGFVESVSVAQTLAARQRQRIDPNQELVGLGAANLAASATGGFPVTGGFARSVVNFDAGARTPMAGVLTALGIALTALVLTPLFAALPRATLAATIIVAVLSLVDIGAIRRAFAYSRVDFAAQAGTIAVTLAAGVEPGILAGIVLSLLLHIWRTSRPHYAIVGQVPGTEHFRNVLRHAVLTSPHVLSIRIDESLYFANARFLEDLIGRLVAERPQLRHVVLMCSAVNLIDASALESLEAINERLHSAGIDLHLSEVKGPVMDRLRRTDFPGRLTGRVFLSQYDAVRALDPASLGPARPEGVREGAPQSG
ncbi:MAG: sulfate permease [Alphaproteobacteria bacterium]|nr:sulfate permease [Alphaproteobacteria bacterium]